MHRVAHRAARLVRGSRHARGTGDNPTSSLSCYPQGSTYPRRFSVQTIGATSYVRHQTDRSTKLPLSSKVEPTPCNRFWNRAFVVGWETPWRKIAC